ncbi:MAG: hypothetical protein LUG88_03840 [Clostridia bacterium]|nr:hypothetical protein [Clostridia bacterium]
MRNLVMRKNIRMLSFALAFMLLLAMALAPRSEAYYPLYSDNDENETILVRGSLQVAKYDDSNYFSAAYGAIRFDSTGVGDLEIYLLDLTVTVICTSSVSSQTFSFSNSESDVSIGDYITATGVKGVKGIKSLTESQKIVKLQAAFVASVHGTTVDYSPATITVFPSQIS